MKRGLFCLIFVVGLVAGISLSRVYREYENNHRAVFRISNTQDLIDYDLLSAINYLKYRLENDGYKVYETKYAGNFYFNEADAAKLNIFVRGFKPFMDLRLAEDKTNIFYLHRYTDIYGVEINGFNYYLSSQHSFLQALNGKFANGYFEGGAVKHKKLKPAYAYDVLYIYEYKNTVLENTVQRFHQHKIYSGIEFAALSENERQKETYHAEQSDHYIMYSLSECPEKTAASEKQKDRNPQRSKQENLLRNPRILIFLKFLFRYRSHSV